MALSDRDDERVRGATTIPRPGATTVMFSTRTRILVLLFAVFSGVAWQQYSARRQWLAAVMLGMSPINTPAAERYFAYSDMPVLTDTVHVVTGANSGLGLAVTRGLARAGATVIMGCRSMARCDAAAETLRAEGNIGFGSGGGGGGDGSGSGKKGVALALETELLDLGSFASVADFARRVASRYSRLHGLQLNAGVMHTPYSLSTDGIELQFAVNHVGHQYLTALLTPQLRAAAPSSVVVCSSAAHLMSVYTEGVRASKAEINLNGPGDYNFLGAYAQSKLANVLFAQELSERLRDSNVRVNAYNPGAVATNLQREWRDATGSKAGEAALFVFDTLYAAARKIMLWSAQESALTALFLGVSPAVLNNPEKTGGYYTSIANEAPVAEHAKNLTLQKRTWALTEALIAEIVGGGGGTSKSS